MRRKIKATCHCGAVVITADLRGDALRPSRCSCSFCKRRQAGNVSCDYSSLRVVSGKEVLRRYQFGTHTAEHYFCGTCGIYTHHRRYSDPAEIGVNIGCITDQTFTDYEPMPWVDGGKGADGTP